MKHSQKVFSTSCPGSPNVARKSGAAGLLLAVILAGFTPAQIAGAALTFQVIYEFTSTSDGAQPSATLVQGTDGNFYGTTTTGPVGVKGTVFKITPGGV